MKQPVIKWIALISGSLANIWNLLIGIFIGANLINDLSGDEGMYSGMGIHILIFLCLILSLISIVLAWFKSKIAGFLMVISAIVAMLLFLLEKIDRFLWNYDVVIIQVVLILVGLLLLYHAYYRKRFLT